MLEETVSILTAQVVKLGVQCPIIIGQTAGEFRINSSYGVYRRYRC
jgi:hypothetical protein